VNVNSFLSPLFTVMGHVLAWFYNIVPNYGVAIIFLTIAIRLILFPLTAKQAKSMIAMQRIQPELKKLQQKYKGDRQKLNEEMMKFYKENKVNPLGGCLPLLLQLPVFWALYRVLEHMHKYVPKDSSMFANMCPNGKCPNPLDLPFLGMNLSQAASKISGGFADAAPYYVLIVLVMVTAYLQSKQTMRNQTQVNTQMQVVGKIMPIVFGFISISLPAGVVLYFLISNLWQMGQQELVLRTIGKEPAPGAAIDVASSERTSFMGKLLKPPPPLVKPVTADDDGEAEVGTDSFGNGKASGRKEGRAGNGSGGAKASKTSGGGGARSGGAGTGAPKPKPKPAHPSSRRKNNRRRKR